MRVNVSLNALETRANKPMQAVESSFKSRITNGPLYGGTKLRSVGPRNRIPAHALDDDDDDDDDDERARRMTSSLVFGQLKRLHDATAGEDTVYELKTEQPFTIGRQSGCEIRLASSAVSRKHAVLTVIDGVPCLKNMSKLNPVTLNERLLDAENAVKLKHGDEIGIQLSPEEEATFIFESIGGELVVRSPLKENGGNTPMSALNTSSSPIKGSPGKSSPKRLPAPGDDENRAPSSQQRSTPRRAAAMNTLIGTPMPTKDILNQVSELKMSETRERRNSSSVKSPARHDVTLIGGDFSFQDDQEHCGTPEEDKLQVPKSPGKSALKAPQNRLATRPSTIRRRSISFASEQELEAIKWIAPHNGKVELCGRIAPIALDTNRSPRQRRTPSRSPVSAIKVAVPIIEEPDSPAQPLALPAPSPKRTASPKKRRSSISFKAVEDGEENETPDASFTRSGSQLQRKDTPRASTRSKPSMTPMSPVDSSMKFTPIVMSEMDDDENVDRTESLPSMTPPASASMNNFMSRMESAAATPSSEFKRPRAPHNTPVAELNNQSPASVGFDLAGWNLFRSTPGATPAALAGVFDRDERCDAILRAVQQLEADAEADMTAADEIDGALATLPTPPSTKKRVQEWLSTDLALAEVPDEEVENKEEPVASLPWNGTGSPSPAKSIVVKMKRKSRRRAKQSGVSLRMDQLHRALKMTRVALVKERKRSEALKEMYLELMSAQQDNVFVASHDQPKTPKVAMNINVKEATPAPVKTPKVAMNINIKETTPKTPKVVMQITINEAAKATPVVSNAQLPKALSPKGKKAAVKSHVCAECEVEDKCKTISCVSCQVVYHLKCCQPKLTRTPKGPWSCSSCPEVEAETAVVAEKRSRESDKADIKPTRSTRSRRN